MKGPNDDKLEQSAHWPLRGTFMIELLNQLNDSDHYGRMMQSHESKHSNRVINGVKAPGWGTIHFIAHDTLFNHSNNNYFVNNSLIFRILYEDAEPPYQVSPVTFKITRFSQWLKSKSMWCSSPFFAFNEGYQMSLRVDSAGDGEGEGTHVSVFLYLMKGPHDDKLKQSGHWPLRGTFTIELLNQLNDSDHYSYLLQFDYLERRRKRINRVINGVKAPGWGTTRFITHETLLNYSNNTYFVNNSLIFRISYEDVEPPYQVSPVTFKITRFSQWLKSKSRWYSSPFFAFNEGYQMSLRVDSAGDGEGTHVSVFLYLMKGPYDDKLEQSGHWPLRGTFTIELLNQLNDSDHYSRQVIYDVGIDYTNRVMEGNTAARGWGFRQYISHNTLSYGNSYHKDDTLNFRISFK